eukprot:2268969-Karenia_brevis.AAC.1
MRMTSTAARDHFVMIAFPTSSRVSTVVGFRLTHQMTFYTLKVQIPALCGSKSSDYQEIGSEFYDEEVEMVTIRT